MLDRVRMRHYIVVHEQVAYFQTRYHPQPPR